MPVLAIAVASLFLLLLMAHYGDERYRAAAAVAFVGHLFVTLVVLPRLPYAWDIAYFHRSAMDVATGTVVTGSQTVASFAAFQGLLYTLFSPQPTTLGVFNGLFAVLVAIPATSLARELYPQTKDTPAVALTVLFLPLPFLFTSIPMRDALAVLLCITLLAVCLRTRTNGAASGLPAIPLWGLLYLLRPELALVVSLGIVATTLVSAARRVGVQSVPTLSVILGVVGCLGFSLFAEVLLPFQRVNAQLQRRATGGAVYLDGMAYRSWFDFLLAAPARGVYFQFAPFPLHVDSAFHLLALTGTVVVIVLFVSAARSLYACEFDETAAVFLGVVYLAGVVGYGTINSNFGTNVRHRMVFDFLLVVFASPILHGWWLRLHEWLGVAPSERGYDDEQQRKA
ncbi:hypothetical protein [Haloarcula amylovorans]|uniref:hypothetical protein n=1 Tax=Haloarcula amylovorans TaxID=2562280 RepID=UPI001076AD79|nr:hypothetical protein [Halomicroarcula amylolytica]